MENHPFITVFDFETTGLNPQNDQVIEIAALRCKGNKIVSEFSTLVKFDGKLAPKIIELTGIRDEDLRDGLDENTSFRIFNRLIQNSVLVAHNAAFDLSFLHYTLKRLAGRSFDNPFIDTLTISRQLLYYPYTLKDTCEQYAIALDGAHRAMNDVYACWELYQRFAQQVDVKKYVNRLSYLRKYGPPRWAPAYADLFPTENKYK